MKCGKRCDLAKYNRKKIHVTGDDWIVFKKSMWFGTGKTWTMECCDCGLKHEVIVDMQKDSTAFQFKRANHKIKMDWEIKLK